MMRHALCLAVALVMTVAMHPLTWAYLEGGAVLQSIASRP
jgi:hypothetical protein